MSESTKIFYTTVAAFLIWVFSANAGELAHEFKNPSFSGNGYSNHVLAMEQLRYQREKEITEKKEAAAAKLARELEQTTLNKFVNNVESRIYAQLSKQLVDNMFTADGSTSGTANIEGATIYWVKDVSSDTISITVTEADGSLTEITVPLTGFGF
jgi:adenosylmethionine-8-amino-7-oxononanoate aminotransferase